MAKMRKKLKRLLLESNPIIKLFKFIFKPKANPDNKGGKNNKNETKK